MTKTDAQKRQDRERAIVRGMIRALKVAGWNVDRVYDGGDEDEITATETEALDAVFAVDESTLWFKNVAGKDHGVYLVCGNDGDIISDYNYSEDPADTFRASMEAYCATLE